MRVLLVSQEVPPETGWGGIGTYIGIIAPALARAGAEVHVLSVVPGQARSRVVRDGVHVHRAPLQRVPGVGRLTRLPETWGRLSLARAVRAEVDTLGFVPDVVEVPEWGAEGLFLTGRPTAPLVVRLHSGAAQIFPHLGRLTLDRRLAVRLEERTVGRADLVTGTAAQMDWAGDRLGVDTRRGATITYPVRPAPPAPAPAGRTILMAGRLEPRKGPDVLVRALPAVLDRVPDARLVLLGKDTAAHGRASYAAWLRELAADLGVGAAVDVVEQWGTEAVEEALAGALVCAVPSRWESFGYVAAEAAALGRPVVASDISALGEIVVDGVTGLLVSPADVKAWAAALARLLTSPDLAARLGAAGRARMRDRCDPDRVAAQTLTAYERVSADARRDRAVSVSG